MYLCSKRVGYTFCSLSRGSPLSLEANCPGSSWAEHQGLIVSGKEDREISRYEWMQLVLMLLQLLTGLFK